MRCLLCGQKFSQKLKLADLLYWRPLLTQRICSHCYLTVKRIDRACPECGRQQQTATRCQDCQRWQRQKQPLLYHQALFIYNQAMHDYFKRYKTLGDYRLRTAFSGDCQRWLRQHQADIYVPIPTDTTRYQQRGFNPVVGLYQCCVPLTFCLKKWPQVKKQAQKNRQQRLQMTQPFYFSGAAAQLTGKKILLLDDVYTTGRTLRHAQNCLLKAVPNCTIRSFSLAR